MAFNPFMPTVAFNICCPRDCVSGHKGGTRGAPIMPRDAVSRTTNVERNGGHKWVIFALNSYRWHSHSTCSMALAETVGGTPLRATQRNAPAEERCTEVRGRVPLRHSSTGKKVIFQVICIH